MIYGIGALLSLLEEGEKSLKESLAFYGPAIRLGWIMSVKEALYLLTKL